jgi:tRNA-splicing endonuclease subunit Sen2
VRLIGSLTLGAGLTAEEVREKRRAERKQFKLDRAQAIVEAAAQAEAAFAEGKIIHPLLNEDGTRAIPSAATWKPTNSSIDPSSQRSHTPQEDIEDLEAIEDLEHLQLTLSEAFFLVWGLDCLTIVDPNSVCNFPALLVHPTSHV